MSFRQLLATQSRQLDEEIRQHIIEIRRVLPELGYQLATTYKEGRNGLIFCAAYYYNRTCANRSFRR